MARNDTREIARLKRLIKKHTDAQVALSWVGTKEPDERSEIEREAQRIKKALADHISIMNTTWRM